MAAPVSATFSESWYRVARQRLSLRRGVVARRQNFRGERWIVIENPFSNQYFRLRPEAYEFVARLQPEKTVEEVWSECLHRFPDSAPGQEAAIQLLSQLYYANLLQYEEASDATQLFERYRKRRRQEIGSQWLNIMFLRLPLLDPDRFLAWALPLVGRLISPLGTVLWLAVVGFGLKAVADHAPDLWDETQGVLAPSNLPFLYLTVIVVKTLHEFGHAFFCRKWGGEVHTMGIMLMIFTPVPYVDATSSWGFRSKWRRALVGMAGMIVELFVAALAALLWVRTGPGAVHTITHNIMFVASVSTLIFNINPLLRFDGYYILSDLIEVPNLHQRAGQQLRYLAEKYLFGVKRGTTPATTPGGAWGYTLFGVGSGIYRVIVFSGILLAIADRFFILGLLMAAACLISWVTVPIGKFLKYLADSPRLERVRHRAWAVSALLFAVLLIALAFIPLPSHFRAPGVVRARARTELAAPAAGVVQAILTPPGSRVQPGQPLLRMGNPELELELRQAAAHLEEVETRLLRARKAETADLKPLMQTQAAVADRLAKLRADAESLTVKAGQEGVWVAPGIQEYVGKWVTRGTNLGLLIDPRSFEFVATVLQEDADAVFRHQQRGAEIRLKGQAGRVCSVGTWAVIPGEQRVLPSPALGFRGGGEVAVSAEDEKGNKAAEPFFKVFARIPEGGSMVLLDGSSGTIRFNLEPEPLLQGWARRLKQLLQKRYQI